MIRNNYKMPKFVDSIFYWILPEIDNVNLRGDYSEIFGEIIRYKGKVKAYRWIAKQIIKSVPLFIMDSIYWSYAMFKNYLRIAIRNFFKQFGYTFINVVGLALGMACCLFIMLWVFHELSFDRFHENADTLYRVEQDQFYSGETYHVNVTPYPMGPGLEEEIPEIIDASRYSGIGTMLFIHGDNRFFEMRVRAVDSSFFQMFTFPLIHGDRESALDDPYSIVISEELAEKYFGNENPLGETITINTQYDFKVTGVLEHLPTNSYLRFDALVPFEFVTELGRYNDSWGSNSIITFVQLQPEAEISTVNQKITDVRHKHVAERIEDPEDLLRFNERQKTQFMVRPLTDIHLYAYFGYGHTPGNIMFVYIFIIIALFVLLIACINFMNLSTARSTGRAREIGLRKVVGAMKSNLIGQFYGESMLLAIIALALAFVLAAGLLPRFNALSGNEFKLTSLLSLKFILGMITITLLTGIISGSYPAVFLSSFQPVKTLRGAHSPGRGGALFRKILVVIQFTLSIFLIIGTTVIYKQLNYMRSKKLGFDREHVIYIPLRGNTEESYELLKTEMKKDPVVVDVTGSWSWPAHFGSNTGGADWEGKDPDQGVLISVNLVDFDYTETMKIEMASGRSFSKSFSTDTSSAFLINEELQRIMDKETAVNERFEIWGREGTIIGVMKNFHFQSMHNDIEPLVLMIWPNSLQYMLVRLQPGDLKKNIERVKSIWEQWIPQYPFVYEFLDKAIDDMYETEQRIGTLVQIFAIMAVVIACLGLFGLASFTAEQRTKEIGIRKTLGASIYGIILMLSREYTKWIIVSAGIAWPVSFLLLSKWLQNYAFRTNLSWWIFIGSGIAALLMAVLTVSYQSIKAAVANPVEALRYE